MKKYIFILIIVLAGIGGVLLVSKFSTKSEKKESVQPDSLNVIYQDKDCDYTVYQNELWDTYMIACSLYFDFQSSNLVMPQNELYKKVQEYFAPYKDHKLIQSMKEYVDSDYPDISFEIMQAIFYDLFAKEHKTEIGEISLSDGKDYKKFYELLNQFYVDTKAHEFFEANQSYYDTYKELLEKEAKKSSIDQLLDLMEQYVNTKSMYYPDMNVHYTSFISAYRPCGGSFCDMTYDNDAYFISYQSTFQEQYNLDSMNVTNMIETSIHEYLHLYINPEVENQKDTIEKLAQGEEKVVYGGQMYENMDWHRIVDENIVRAVETRIYGQFYQSLAQAYDQVLRKEVEWGGFSKVDLIYKNLENYEAHRDQYDSIADYTGKLVEVLFGDKTQDHIEDTSI